MSSPVAEPGPGENVATPVSIGAPSRSQNWVNRGSRGRAGAGSRGASAARTLSARGPESRTRARAERPAGVARATIVSR